MQVKEGQITQGKFLAKKGQNNGIFLNIWPESADIMTFGIICFYISLEFGFKATTTTEQMHTHK